MTIICSLQFGRKTNTHEHALTHQVVESTLLLKLLGSILILLALDYEII